MSGGCRLVFQVRGLISYAGIKLLSGRGREVPWLVYLLAGMFILRFVYLKSL